MIVYEMAKNGSKIRRAFNWLGIEANNRAIMSLLAIGTLVGGIAVFAFNQLAPVYSPTFSKTAYGEGYRRGRREAELENKLRAAQNTLEAIRTREQIDREIRSMTDEELSEAFGKWVRD